MSELGRQDPLPPELYRGGFVNSAGVVTGLIDRFEIARPVTIYYPGSSTDVSLMDVPEARVIHADVNLTFKELDVLTEFGAEAHRVDAEEWGPQSPVDIVAFINPSGLNQSRVLDKVDLRPGGLVLWYFWSVTSRPHGLVERDDIKPVAAVQITEEGEVSFDTGDIAEYFIPKTFGELSKEEQRAFIDAFRHKYVLNEGSTFEEVYAQLQQPDFFLEADAIGVTRFPYRKEAGCFVFQKS